MVGSSSTSDTGMALAFGSNNAGSGNVGPYSWSFCADQRRSNARS